jgi:hypothetical protein
VRGGHELASELVPGGLQLPQPRLQRGTLARLLPQRRAQPLHSRLGHGAASAHEPAALLRVRQPLAAAGHAGRGAADRKCCCRRCGGLLHVASKIVRRRACLAATHRAAACALRCCGGAVVRTARGRVPLRAAVCPACMLAAAAARAAVAPAASASRSSSLHVVCVADQHPAQAGAGHGRGPGTQHLSCLLARRRMHAAAPAPPSPRSPSSSSGSMSAAQHGLQPLQLAARVHQLILSRAPHSALRVQFPCGGAL